MKLSSLLPISILLCIFVASFSIISPVKAVADVYIRTSQCSGHHIADGLYVVYGEVHNRGDVPADSISFIVDMRDMWAFGGGTGASMGLVLVELSSSPIVLHPGESWPWEAQFTYDEEEIDVNNFNVEAPTFSETDALPIGLEIVSHSSDSPGTVVGEVQNIGTEPTTGIRVGASFYGATGAVVATASSSIPGMLNPGENAAFSIALEYPDLAPLIDSYAVTAQSQEYVIPEFPMWTSMLLLLVVLTVALAIYKRRLFKTPIR